MEKLQLALLNIWEGINREEPLGKNELEKLITNLAEIALALISTIAVIFLILGGFQYITSAGNPDNVGKAKNTILYAIIGLILAIMSYSIISFITSKL